MSSHPCLFSVPPLYWASAIDLRMSPQLPAGHVVLVKVLMQVLCRKRPLEALADERKKLDVELQSMQNRKRELESKINRAKDCPSLLFSCFQATKGDTSFQFLLASHCSLHAILGPQL